jgi:hypothetical protein
MGYTHYYYVKDHYDRQTFKQIVADFEKVLPVLEHVGVKLAGPFGDGKPIINEESIAFNGLEKCGHQQRELGITWPSKEAHGIAMLSKQHLMGNESKENVIGHWFAGATLDTRTCDGDCSHESFRLDRDSFNDKKEAVTSDTWKHGSDNITYRTTPNKIGKFFECTKTAYKPYDLAVTICLVIAKHYLKDDIAISSDGELEQWQDAITICKQFLNYGDGFKLDEPEIVENDKPKENIKIDFAEIERKEKERQILKSLPVKLGDIFERSWGYEQTNVDFYKVIELTKSGKSAKVIRIGQKKVKQTGDMSELVEPDPNKLTDETHTYRIKQYRSDGSIYIGGLWRWDGTPCHQSHYA